MEEVQSIVALGAGTVSKRVLQGKITRCDTHKDVDLYIDGINEMIERKRKLFDGDSDCDR
jgi:oxygen-independent coproporphyrinogen-3 oxidase